MTKIVSFSDLQKFTCNTHLYIWLYDTSPFRTLKRKALYLIQITEYIYGICVHIIVYLIIHVIYNTLLFKMCKVIKEMLHSLRILLCQKFGMSFFKSDISLYSIYCFWFCNQCYEVDILIRLCTMWIRVSYRRSLVRATPHTVLLQWGLSRPSSTIFVKHSVTRYNKCNIGNITMFSFVLISIAYLSVILLFCVFRRAKLLIV